MPLPPTNIRPFRQLEGKTVRFEAPDTVAEPGDEEEIPTDCVSVTNPYRHNGPKDLLDPIRGLLLSEVPNQVVIQTNYQPQAKQNQFKLRGLSNDEVYHITLEERKKAQEAEILTTLAGLEEWVRLSLFIKSK